MRLPVYPPPPPLCCFWIVTPKVLVLKSFCAFACMFYVTTTYFCILHVDKIMHHARLIALYYIHGIWSAMTGVNMCLINQNTFNYRYVVLQLRIVHWRVRSRYLREIVLSWFFIHLIFKHRKIWRNLSKEVVFGYLREKVFELEMGCFVERGFVPSSGFEREPSWVRVRRLAQ